MRKRDVVELLRQNRDKLKEFGVKRVGIFGSAVRDELRDDSDIDLIVEFEEGKGNLFNFYDFVEFVENLFGRKVDVLTPLGVESIRIKSVKERIKKEVEYV